MDIHYFEQLAKYNIWANQKAQIWLESISQEDWLKKMGGSMDSLAATAIHIAGAEKVWLERLEDRIEPFLLNAFPIEGPREELMEIWTKASNQLLSYIQGKTDSEILTSIHYKNIKGEEFNSKIAEALAHVFNHSTYHRGQIVNYLRQLGFTDLSSTDLIVFYRMK